MKKYLIFALLLILYSPVSLADQSISMRNDACPNTEFEKPTLLERLNFERNGRSCKSVIMACHEGFSYELPFEIFSEIGTYQIHYKEKRVWSYKCLLHYAGKNSNISRKSDFDYGCSQTGEARVSMHRNQDKLVIFHHYNGFREDECIHCNSAWNEYPENIAVKVLKDKNVVFETNINLAYTVNRIHDPFCQQQVCCYGTPK